MDELKQPEKYSFKISALSQSEVKILPLKVRGGTDEEVFLVDRT